MTIKTFLISLGIVYIAGVILYTIIIINNLIYFKKWLENTEDQKILQYLNDTSKDVQTLALELKAGGIKVWTVYSIGTFFDFGILWPLQFFDKR